MVQNMLYIAKTDLKQCFVTKLHFHRDKFAKIAPVESQNHFLLKEAIQTKSYMVKMRVYLRVYIKLTKMFEKNKRPPPKKILIPTWSLDGFELPRPSLGAF